MNNKSIKQKILADFMTRVNKLSVSCSTSDKYFGRVTCKKAAVAKGSYGGNVSRKKYGTRIFSLTDSHMIPNGKYTLNSLRETLASVID